MSIARGKTIFLISPESWGSNFVSKHHYAQELGSRGYKVWFFNPPRAKLVVKKSTVSRVSDNLVIVDYEYPKGLNRLPAQVRRKVLLGLANQLKKNLQVTPDVVWNFDPYVFQDLSVFGSQVFKIYHPVDLHQTPLDKELEDSSDLILSTANVILNKNVGNVEKKNLIGHGLAPHFLDSYTQNGLKHVPISNNVGIVGNMQRGMNYKVLVACVTKLPEINFHFVGPDGPSNLSNTESYTDQINELKKFANTFFHGTLPNKKLPMRLSEMDLFLSIYLETENPATMENPHKILEFLSTGKPIICFPAQFYLEKPHLVTIPENMESIPDLIEGIFKEYHIHHSNSNRDLRINYAKERTYGILIKKIENLIYKA